MNVYLESHVPVIVPLRHHVFQLRPGRPGWIQVPDFPAVEFFPQVAARILLQKTWTLHGVESSGQEMSQDCESFRDFFESEHHN